MTSVLLIDVSGSMIETIQGIRKIDSVRIAVSSLKGFKRFTFSDVIGKDDIPDPHGETRMVCAFQYMRTIEEYSRIILISDGITSDGIPESLEAGIAIGKPIDVLYIGKDKIGEDFMKQLAEATGGREITISQTLQLSQALRANIQMLSGVSS